MTELRGTSLRGRAPPEAFVPWGVFTSQRDAELVAARRFAGAEHYVRVTGSGYTWLLEVATDEPARV